MGFIDKKRCCALWLFLGANLLICGKAGAYEKKQIVTSLFPLMEFAQAVAQDSADVHLLIPPGAEVHTWQPRPSDIMQLSSADLFIFIGYGLEPWVPGLLRSVSSASLIAIEVGKILALAEQGGEGEKPDPHIWLDPELDQRIVDEICRILSEIEPARSSFFEANAALYKKRLRELDLSYKIGLETCRHRTFLLAGHTAFSFLARRYHLEQLALSGLSPDAEPSPTRIIEIIRWAKEHRVTAVFMEAYASDRMAKMLARELKAKILILNPGANLSQEQRLQGLTFFDIMEANLHNLKIGLGCD